MPWVILLLYLSISTHQELPAFFTNMGNTPSTLEEILRSSNTDARHSKFNNYRKKKLTVYNGVNPGYYHLLFLVAVRLIVTFVRLARGDGPSQPLQTPTAMEQRPSRSIDLRHSTFNDFWDLAATLYLEGGPLRTY